MNYNWLFIASLTTLSFSYGEETKVKNKTTNKLNSKSPSDRWQAKKKFIGSWMEHVRRQWEDEEPDPERGPVRESNYNPNYGYEPYWPGGEWVHVTTPTPKTRKTEESPRTQKTEYSPRLLGDMNCGLKCGVIYKTYGEVCGRNKRLEYRSFPNYCALKSQDCQRVDDWRAVYAGPCKTVSLLWPTSIVFGPKKYINDFQSRYQNTFGFVATNVGFPNSYLRVIKK